MRMIPAMVMAAAALLASTATRADPGAFPPPDPPSTAFSPPRPDLTSTQLRIVPPAQGTVTIVDGDVTLGRFSLPATLSVSTGKTYDVIAARGPSVLFRASVSATGGIIDMTWGDGAKPDIRVTPPVIVAAPPPANHPGPFTPPRPRGMKGGSFQSLIALLESTSFSSDQLAVVSTAASRNHFTVAQVGAILDTLDFSSDRLAAVRMLKDRIVDPENGFLLAQHFDFSVDKQKVAALFDR